VVVERLITGLKRLEYRGYDSAGICVEDGGKTVIVKKVGNVANLEQLALRENAGNLSMDTVVKEHTSMAHTRWATHGAPCDINAHPQSNTDDNEFVVIHNGIMTNFSETKAFLQSKGYSFRSETDTEVICALAKYLYTEAVSQGKTLAFQELVMEVMSLTGGAFAMVFKSYHYPNEIVACKKGSPLIVGFRTSVGQESRAAATHTPIDVSSRGPTDSLEVFLASDSSAIAEYTKNVVYLNDEDVVKVAHGKMEYFNRLTSATNPQPREVQQLEVALESLSRGGYPHFMLKEIFEQTESVFNSMRGRVNFGNGKVSLGGFNNQRKTLRSARRLMFISCGTSLNACIAMRPLFDELCQVPIAVENASDFLDRSPSIFRDDVCIFVSQSGETADTLRALEYCRDRGAILVGFTNTVGSSISRQTDFGAHLNCGVEVGVASTKAFTSQIVAMTLLALLIADDSVSLAQRRLDIIHELSALSGKIADCLKLVDEKMKALALRLKSEKSVLVLGRGYQYAACLEAALKIKELTYIHTEGINSGELKHGPLALIDENIPVIVMATKDALIDRARSAVQQINARKGKVIAVISEADPEIEAVADTIIRVPGTTDCLQCILNIIPMQLLAYHLAVARGNNVDCPRNLAKSVTTQ
jgi:glucosamine--fructose-6-phosphate aminotransferase (isomerizing)